MRKKLLYVLLLIITVSLISSNCVITVFAKEIIEFAKGISMLLSEDAEFSDDKVIVVLTDQGSLDYKNINEDYFSLVECKSIRDLTASSTRKIKSALEKLEQSIAFGKNLIIPVGTDFSDYRRILCLELNNAGRKNVIDAINRINKLDGVLYAIPNYKLSIDATNEIAQVSNVNNQPPSEIYNLMGLGDAWDAVSEYSTSTVRVAVIDSGIDTSHNALSGIIDTTTSARFRNYSGDGNNYEEDGVLGEHIDDSGHGTHVAGIIAASYNSVIGTRGVCASVNSFQ